LFGGMDERSVFHNDLWLLQPDYEYNRDQIAVLDCEFMGRSRLGLTLHKINDYSGVPPCPRSNFQMTNLLSNGDQLLVIYGGRNDAIFA
jgi:hypothetical protein